MVQHILLLETLQCWNLLMDKTANEKYILYQGSVNEGRCFETLIPAMQFVNAPLVICGEGNFMHKAKALACQYKLEHKIIFKGKILPEALKKITRQAAIGITLFDKEGISNYYSLANRFFDYIHARYIPQLCVDYPVYRELNETYCVASLITDISAQNIATQLNNLLENTVLYEKLEQNCLSARLLLQWANEEKMLLHFYTNLFN